jgi:hypothetical protein
MKALNYYDEAGNLVFYMFLVDDPLECTMKFHCSIERSLISTKNSERYIACLEERVVQEPIRQHFVDKLIECIRKECNLTGVKEG